MTMKCTPEVLNRITKAYPGMTVAEFIAMLQVRKAVEGLK